MNELSLQGLHGDLDGVIRSLLNLSQLARREGLLALEDVIQQIEAIPSLAKIGLELVIDGNEPNLVDLILTELIAAEGYGSAEAQMEAALIRTGILSIQRGENPRTLLSRLTASLGIETYMRYGKQQREWQFSPEAFTVFGELYEASHFSQGILTDDELDSLLTDGPQGMTISASWPYENRVSYLVVSGLISLLEQYEHREELLGRSIPDEFIVSAMHVLPSEALCQVLNAGHLPQEISTLFAQDRHTDEAHISAAEQFFEWLMES